MTSKHPEWHDEDVARAHLEAIRWPKGPVCPFCGGVEKIAAYGPSMGPGAEGKEADLPTG